jgi:mRNA guanylyltransferase
MQKGYGIDMMFRDILPNLAHGNDGLIFTAVKREYICGTDPFMYSTP